MMILEQYYLFGDHILLDISAKCTLINQYLQLSGLIVLITSNIWPVISCHKSYTWHVIFNFIKNI